LLIKKVPLTFIALSGRCKIEFAASIQFAAGAVIETDVAERVA